MDMSGGEIKVQCCKEQYYMGTWNVRFMNQAKLDVVKQEMARVNIDLSEISELKWTRKVKFNSEDHYIYYCGQESLRRNEIALIVKKRGLNTVYRGNIRSDRTVSVHFEGKPFDMMVIQVYALTTNAEEAEVEYL